MAKLAPTSIKYIIRATIKAKGIVEKPDVIGALFGQTEGLLGPDLDLRELQRTGRIGRIEVNIKPVEGNSEGEVIIPSSLDSAETSLIAATLETIDRVGPCTAEIKLVGVEDTRSVKRQFVVEKAKDILKTLMDTGGAASDEISEQIKESIRVDEITDYNGVPAGPGIAESEEIVVVEGRADVLNLLKNGVKNVIAIEGTSVPQVVADLTREKIVTIFVDGDRGGQLIIKEMLQKGEIDFVAVAPIGREVEELAKKEIFKALRDKVPIEKYKSEERPFKSDRPERRGRREGRFGFGPSRARRAFGGDRRDRFEREGRPGYMPADSGTGESMYPARRFEPEVARTPRIKPEQRDLFKSALEDIVGTRAACIFNEQGELLGKVPVSELANTIRTMEKPFAVVFDGRVDADLEAVARRAGVKFLICMQKDNIRSPVGILSREDLDKQ